MKKYIPSEIENKWQKIWRQKAIYKVDLSKAGKKFYLLVEFTYPSGDLHMGHWFAFSVPDILARMKRMQGFSVFAPNGFDSFGLPAENAAIKRNIHPRDWTLDNIEKMKEQFSTMGAIYDWEHQVITCESDYYRWNQWIFLKMLEKGLVYRGKAMANWCPKDQSVLANENVENGKCWRCGEEVIQKEVDQWFLKITEYADKLLWSDNPSVDWPKALREGQNNWIGKSEGVEIEFGVEGSDESVRVFTKFPETIFGVTFMVLAPEHPMVSNLTTKENHKQVNEYIAKSAKKSELERKESKEKTGTFTGSYVTNPVNGEKVPVWVADYVIGGYGTGAVMGVPGSDLRDFEFAKKFGFKVIKVIAKTLDDQKEIESASDVLDEGYIVNSGQFNNLKSSSVAKEKFIEYLVKKGWGRRKVNYHLHDWSISRQRYWGTPIPIIYCDDCGVVPVPEKDLPVELPYEVDYAPQGKPPLATADDWVNVKCPNCNKDARREVETMDTFVDSSWYFLRYLDPANKKQIAGKKVLADWMPVDIYFGGAEHTLGHTLYSRFFVKFLKDIGELDFDEYAKLRVHHGVILGPDGSRMSKSKGNVVNPDEQVKEYGADAVRLYLAFLGPYDLVAPWVPTGLNGVYHFLERVWALVDSVEKSGESRVESGDLANESRIVMNRTIKKVTEDVENTKFNTAVASMMEWLNYLSKIDHGGAGVSRQEYESLLKLLAPFAPHITDELWEILGNHDSIHSQVWPEWDEKLIIGQMVTIVVQINGKVRGQFEVERGAEQQVVEEKAQELPKVKEFIGDKTQKKVIFVPDKLINFVV